jgi:GGDEF domain-containing protein
MDNQQRYREILEQAHEQMAAAAVDALPEMVGGAAAAQLTNERQELSHVIQRFQQEGSPQESSDSPAATTTAVAEEPTDPGLMGRLSNAISTCRRTRQEVSLALLEVEDYDGLLLKLGPERLGDIMRSLETAIYANSDYECDCLLATDARYAVILPQCDRQQTVATAKRFLEEIPKWVATYTGGVVELQCSAGIATLAAPSSNFLPQNLVDAAERCLFATQASGGRIVKSIDLW